MMHNPLQSRRRCNQRPGARLLQALVFAAAALLCMAHAQEPAPAPAPEQPQAEAPPVGAELQALRAEHPALQIEKTTEGMPPSLVVQLAAKAAEPKPAVILLHPYQESKRALLDNGWAADLAYEGYLVLLPDAWGHGERDVAAREAIEAKNFYAALTETVAHTLEDLPALHAYLAARPDVDAQRIGLMGYSLGGCITLAAAAREPVFAAYAAISGACDYVTWAEEDGLHAADPLTPETVALIRGFDPVYQIEAINNRPLLFVHGVHDRLVPIRYARKLYDLLAPNYIESGGRLEWKQFDVFPLPANREPAQSEVFGTHRVSAGMAQAAFDWLKQWLRPQTQSTPTAPAPPKEAPAPPEEAAPAAPAPPEAAPAPPPQPAAPASAG